MVIADVMEEKGAKDDIMTLQFMVLVLDETCHDRHFTKPSLPQQNGVEMPSHSTDKTDKIEGILSKSDINLLLTMFDTGIPNSISSYGPRLILN